MLFNSIEFAFFLPLVFFIYWFITNKTIRVQNFFLLVVSYIFYGWWDWRFLSLILFSTIVDFFVGKQLLKQEDPRKRKFLLFISILVNLGFLGFFKYYNFFVESFADAFTFWGEEIDAFALNIILPVGISFYTFQTLSYSLDVYRKNIKPTTDFISFAAFVSFFPQLVAGPIERATNLLPQFYKKREFSYPLAIDGMRQILWGLFKKVVIADTCAEYVNLIFNNPETHSGSTLALGAFLFAFQVYGDFSGYSDIAIGVSRLFGFNLMQNFRYPFFATSITTFWRRWHISLYTWFTDYLFQPLAIAWRNLGKAGVIMALLTTFTLSGLWHGAAWHFILFGVIHGIGLVFETVTKKIRKKMYKSMPSVFKPILGGTATFIFCCFAFIFFRAKSMDVAVDYIMGIFDVSLFSVPEELPTRMLILLTVFIIAEWIQRDKVHALCFKEVKVHSLIRWGSYLMVALFIAAFFGKGSTFIYFQF